MPPELGLSAVSAVSSQDRAAAQDTEAPPASPAPLPSDVVSHQPAATKAEKKRRRPALSCEQCRRRKIRCDRGLPCVNCIKSNISPCTYAPTHVPASRTRKAASNGREFDAPDVSSHVPARSAPVFEFQRPSAVTNPAPKAVSSSVPSSTVGSTSDGSTVDALAARVRELEQKLSETFLASRLADDRLENHREQEHEHAPMKGTVSKTRFFGQSHWMNGADMFPSILGIMSQAEARKMGPHRIFVRCKTLARTIKENRLKPISSSSLGKSIPMKSLADQLVDAYFRTFEGTVRILHVPTFRAEYERYWQNPSAANDVFVMQLQLCMALGATVHDDLFSLRSAAMQWVHEAQLWLLLPPEKSRMTIGGIQIMCMLTIAKATCAVGQDLTWVAAGGLVRQAMYMGLHRDPKHLADMSVYRAEMRRRLWATILELNLQSSYDAGGPPLISAHHYDTQLPANINDDQLSDESERTKAPPNKPDALTDMSVQLALLKSQALRLTIIRHVNELRSQESYPETLRLNSELTKACRRLTEALAALTYAQKQVTRPIITQFHCSLVQLFIYRCFISLHLPMLRRAAEDPTMYYSRKVSLDCSLKIAQICNLSYPRFPSAPPGSLDPRTSFDRLITNGAGLFRVVPVQTLFFVAMELIKKKEEERDALDTIPSMGSRELRLVLEAAMVWTERRIRSGETNIKGHCFIAACIALADAIDKRLPQAQIDQAVIATGESSSLKSWELLKEIAVREGISINDDGSPAGLDEPVEAMEGIAEMPLDWMSDFNWDSMSDFSWGRQVPREFGDMESVDPSFMSQF
ncbi:hypothetical protein B0J13DRAFT_616132 [Dactylonectria estremocensis]|uniref:Zn(2)-C6 fungal-type domain-containing protein n=1 Tax=Dactylonectria estremocensis TaxID=1079267 RepID=A0A9P9FMD5_9HYPO|nr:hypothetical protein B0J13DRAFT_616132 [Dactylonectria estremocensis]